MFKNRKRGWLKCWTIALNDLFLNQTRFNSLLQSPLIVTVLKKINWHIIKNVCFFYVPHKSRRFGTSWRYVNNDNFHELYFYKKTLERRWDSDINEYVICTSTGCLIICTIYSVIYIITYRIANNKIFS